MEKAVFFIGLILAASGLLSPPLALAAGRLYGLTLAHRYDLEARRLSKFLLQASLVGLGLGMNLAEVVKVGRSGFLYTACGITAAMLLGLAIGRWFGVARAPSILITAGTAISVLQKSKRSNQWPWFIGLFCLAAGANTYVRFLGFAYSGLSHLGQLGLTITLYRIGSGLSMATLLQVSVRSLLQGYLLWAIVAIGSLMLILQGWIRL